MNELTITIQADTEHEAFKMAVKEYKSKLWDERDINPYNVSAQLINKTYVSEKDDSTNYYLFDFKCWM